MTVEPIGAFSARPVFTPEQEREARDEAWLRYIRIPHASISVGWQEYCDAIDAINALCGEGR